MTTIQVFGFTGMLGQAVCRAVHKAGHTLFMVQEIRFLTDKHPVINCAGCVKQKDASPLQFIEANSMLPHQISYYVPRMVHVSTDCVFNHSGVHSETDYYISGTDVYARSKFAGEVTKHPHLTVRTSFVGYGRHGLIQQMQSQEQVTASNRLLWSGHTADTIADILVYLATREDVTGLLHIPGEFTTRWELCNLLKRHLPLRAEIVRDDSFVADRRLVSNRWDSLGMPELIPFEEQVKRLK